MTRTLAIGAAAVALVAAPIGAAATTRQSAPAGDAQSLVGNGSIFLLVTVALVAAAVAFLPDEPASP